MSSHRELKALCAMREARQAFYSDAERLQVARAAFWRAHARGGNLRRFEWFMWKYERRSDDRWRELQVAIMRYDRVTNPEPMRVALP